MFENTTQTFDKTTSIKNKNTNNNTNKKDEPQLPPDLLKPNPQFNITWA